MGYSTEYQRVEPYDKVRCKCGSKKIKYRLWESIDGGHEDKKYKCDDCELEWWVEGADA